MKLLEDLSDLFSSNSISGGHRALPLAGLVACLGHRMDICPGQVVSSPLRFTPGCFKGLRWWVSPRGEPSHSRLDTGVI